MITIKIYQKSSAIDIEIWKLGLECGWFSGGDFSLLKIALFERTEYAIYIISIAFLKFCVSLRLELQD